MISANNRYTLIIGWLKIILPLISLGLLSSLFIFSRSIDSGRPVQVIDTGLQERAQSRGVSDPIFAGLTDKKEQIQIQAKYAHPLDADMQHFNAQNVDAEIKPLAGGVIYVTSNKADIRQHNDEATLIDDVVVTTDTGYRLKTMLLETRFDTVFAESPVPVFGNGPIGDIKADRMVLTSDETTGDAHLLFEGHVKVTYDPPNSGG